MSLFYYYKKQFMRELLLRSRDIKSSMNAILFFLMIVVFFPLTLPPSAQILLTATPGIIWVGMIFALFLSSEMMFARDYTNGVIEQWLVSSAPISILVLAKISVHWLVNILAVLLISPIIALLLKLNWYVYLSIIASITLGTPTIVALCALAESCAVGLQQKGVIMAVILLPLSIPILILGSSLIMQAMLGNSINAYLALLLALSCIAFTFIPIAISFVIRESLA